MYGEYILGIFAFVLLSQVLQLRSDLLPKLIVSRSSLVEVG